MPSIRLLACVSLAILPTATCLAVGPRRTPTPKAFGGSNSNSPAMPMPRASLRAAIPVIDGRCAPLPLESPRCTSICHVHYPRNCPRRRHLINEVQWYECTEPASDPMMTCILAPEWMGLAEDTWLCSDDVYSDDMKPRRPSYGDDSYVALN